MRMRVAGRVPASRYAKCRAFQDDLAKTRRNTATVVDDRKPGLRRAARLASVPQPSPDDDAIVASRIQGGNHQKRPAQGRAGVAG
jgi:hypothetical protein